MLLIYCDFAILVLRAQGSLLWFKMDYYMLLNYGIIHRYPLETALLDNYPLNWFFFSISLCHQQKTCYQYNVLDLKGIRWSFLLEIGIMLS